MSTRRNISFIAILVCFSLFCSMFLTGCPDDALSMVNEIETSSSVIEESSKKIATPTPNEKPTPTPTEEPTPSPTETPTEPPTPTPVAKNKSDDDTVMVWIPRTGHKYHMKKSCSNMRNPKEVTLNEAKEKGYTACSRCC